MPMVARFSLPLLLAALAITLAPKALVTRIHAAEDLSRLDRDIARRLEERGFAYARRKEVDRPATFYAQHSRCRVVVRHATEPAGFDRKYRQNAEAVGPLHYRIGSRSFTAPPLLNMWIADKLHLAAIRLGVADPRPAPLAIAMSADCPPDILRTEDLLVYPQASG